LNKGFEPEDYKLQNSLHFNAIEEDKIAEFASRSEFPLKLRIDIRAFILLNLPFITNETETIK
jgi:hypothetical protein